MAHLEGHELILFVLVAVYLVFAICFWTTGVWAPGFQSEVYYWLPGLLAVVACILILVALWFRPKHNKTFLLLGLIVFLCFAIWAAVTLVIAITKEMPLGNTIMIGVSLAFLLAICYYNWKVYKYW